jgi:hypothetical protein
LRYFENLQGSAFLWVKKQIGVKCVFWIEYNNLTQKQDAEERRTGNFWAQEAYHFVAEERISVRMIATTRTSLLSPSPLRPSLVQAQGVNFC